MAELGRALASGAKRAVYTTGQAMRVLWHTGHYAAGRRLMGPLTDPGEAPYAEASGPLDRKRLQRSFREAFERDWSHIEKGEYRLPPEFRRPPSLRTLFKQSRDYLRDTKEVARRKHRRAHSDVLFEATRDKYPRYFLQNFHYQSGGWMTAASAERYEMQVETLFTGAAGPMRRIALPMIREALKQSDAGTAALLDIGCGTGRLLEEIKHNWPQISATALDLSPAYLGKAQAVLGRWPDIAYVEANAENTGLTTGAFDIITAVYLFHELPPKVRVIVAKEITRLLKPGGVLIQLDTIQYGDEPGLDILLENFPRGFHEPYYDSYCKTDLDALFGAAGLVSEGEAKSFLTKAKRYQKPLSS